jgi:exonuclease VII large subunit
VLSRGYAVVSQKDGKVVSRAKLVKSGETLKVQVSDGDFGVTVNDGSK